MGAVSSADSLAGALPGTVGRAQQGCGLLASGSELPVVLTAVIQDSGTHQVSTGVWEGPRTSQLQEWLTLSWFPPLRSSCSAPGSETV